MDKTPDQILQQIAAAATEQMLAVIRDRLTKQRELLEKMENGSVPLPSKSVRGLLMQELDSQITQCAMYETKAKDPNVKVMVQECGAWAAEAKLRLNKLFAAESGTGSDLAN